jgi:MSHA biogenesis protein MshQ
VLYWAFDEATWNGTANEVQDSSGNGLHGRGLPTGAPYGGPVTANALPPIAGTPGTCRYGVLDGVNDAVETADHALLDITDEMTVMMWLRPTAVPGGAFGSTGTLRSFVSKDNNYEAHLAGGGAIYWWWGGGALQLISAGAVPANAWTHVALVYSRSGGFQRIYINGVQDANTNNQTGALPTNNLPFQIGGDQGFAGREYQGQVDEVRVFRQALGPGRISALMNETHLCPSFLNHFSINHAGGGVACDTHQVDIIAHDAAHQPVDAGALLVNLSTSNARGTWTGVVAGGGILIDTVAGDGAATYQFPIGTNQATLNFRYANLAATSEAFSFNVSGGGFSEVGGVANASDDPTFTMAQAGFRFRNVTDNSTTIPVQISGKPSNTGYNAKTIRVQAIRTDTATGACTPLFASQTRSVDLGAECNNPVNCAARQVSINGGNIATSANNGAAGAAAYTSVSLAFTASSEADAVIAYPDAGQISLHARYDLDTGVAGYEAVGSTNTFLVRPFGLAMPGINHSSSAAGTLIGAAGDAFTMTVQGYQWAAGEDANNDGFPDTGVNITNNGTVPNFAATATLGVTANLPGTAPGTISRGAACVGVASIVLTGGVGTASDWCYSEVGNVLLSATVADYLGAGVSVPGSSAYDGVGGGGYVGRFKPKFFAVSGTPTLTNRSVLACASSFSYLGEELNVGFTLEARNTAGAVTQNYNGAYAKLNLASAASLGIGARSGATNLTARVDSALAPAGAFANGVAALSVPVAVNRNSPDAPDGPFAGTQFGIAANDADPNLATGVQMGSFNQDVDGVGGNDHFAVGPTTQLRFGRLVLGNAYGATGLALNLPAQVHHWNGSAFALNTLDSCSRLDRSDIALGFGGGLSACQSAITQATIAFSGGNAVLTLAAPNNAGTVGLTANLGTAGGSYCNLVGGASAAATFSAMDYLLGRWNEAVNPDGNASTSYDDKPAGQGAFGLYGSQPNNFIFRRENF